MLTLPTSIASALDRSTTFTDEHLPAHRPRYPHCGHANAQLNSNLNRRILAAITACCGWRDLDGADKVGRVHLAEALSYRALTDEIRRAA
jgi:hypothetical protein